MNKLDKYLHALQVAWAVCAGVLIPVLTLFVAVAAWWEHRASRGLVIETLVCDVILVALAFAYLRLSRVPSSHDADTPGGDTPPPVGGA